MNADPSGGKASRRTRTLYS